MKSDTVPALAAHFSENNIFLADKKHGSLADKTNSLIKATLTSITGKTATLTIKAADIRAASDLIFTADADKISGEPGDELLFEVLKSDAAGFTLKQVKAPKTAAEDKKKEDFAQIKDLFQQQGLYEKDGGSAAAQKEQKKIADACARIKRRLENGAKNSAGLIAMLAAQGLSVEKLSVEAFASVMDSRRKAESEAAPLKRAETYDSAEILKSHGLGPDAEKQARAAVSRFRAAREIGSEGILELIRKELPLTIDNIYKERFQSPDANREDAPDPRLDRQITDLLRRSGIPAGPASLEAARRMVQKDIPVTRENLDKAKFLSTLDKIPEEDIFHSACENITSGRPAWDIDLCPRKEPAQLQREYREIASLLPGITPFVIQRAISSGVTINLRALTDFYVAGVSEGLRNAGAVPSPEALEIKKTLLEVQFKLTAEAASRLSGKGLDITVLPVKEALAALNDEISSEYEESVKAAGAGKPDENVSALQALYDKIRVITPVPRSLFGDIIQKRVDFSIDGMSGAVLKRPDFTAYEATENIRSKYGDALRNPEEEFGKLLRSLAIGDDDDNIRAARILSANKLDVTAENIMKVLGIDLKVRAIADTLHPAIAADMLKNNLNPAQMHVDEVLSYIEKFNDKYGGGLSDKIAERLFEMEKSGELDQNAKKSVVAVFRMLSFIQKNGGAAIGAGIAASDESQTIGRLFRNAVYMGLSGRRGRAEIAVGDKISARLPSAGARTLSDIEAFLSDNLMAATETNVTKAGEVFDTASENPDLAILAWQNQALALREITAKAGNAAFAAFAENNPDFADLPLESAIALLRENLPLEDAPRAPLDISEASEALLSAARDVSPDALKLLMDANMPVTVNNIAAAANLLKKNGFIADKLNELINESGEGDFEYLPDLAESLGLTGDIDEEALRGRLDDLTGNLSAAADLAAFDSPPRLRETIREIAAAASLRSALGRRRGDGSFSIPVKLHDRVAGLDVRIINPSPNPTVYMSLSASNLGDLELYAEPKGASLSLRVKSSTGGFAGSEGELRELLDSLGFPEAEIIIEA
ncbi:MAG: DUF6240 domain-containing protein [Clostridiales bacterium]|nr:DUF6240 domain-containing protein [Clostridiales bacterium]